MEYSVAKFNRMLNESVSAQEQFLRWTDYREAVTSFASEAMIADASSIVLGAGNLYDIDLNTLNKYSNQIVLADIDRQAVLQGVKRYGSEGDIRVIRNDLGGLDFNSVFKKTAAYIDKGDTEGLRNYLSGYKFEDNFDTGTYDNILVSSIYTQLFIPQFLELLHETNPASKEELIEAALSFAARLISHVNDLILMHAADEASVCVWTDMFEYATGSPALSDIENHIDDSKWMDDFYYAYIRDYGHGLGTFGISEMSDRLKDVKQKWLLWPFNDYRTLVVKIINGFTSK